MIRVVHSTPIWLPQTQTWLYTQVSCVPPERVENHVVCQEVENLDQFPIRHLHNFALASNLERSWDRRLMRYGVRRHLGFLARVARRVGAAVIHSHFGDKAWANLGAAKAAGARHVVTFYGYDMSSFPRQALWRERFLELFDTVDLVLCEGPHMARGVVALGCPEEKVRVQHLGIRLDQLPFQPRRWHPGGKLRVLIAATFTEKKGIPYALAALGRLQHEVDLEITVIGDARQEVAESRSEKETILAVIEAQGLADKVRLLGYQSHATLLKEAYDHHVFLSPSLTAKDGGTEGGAPVSIIEMAASGMFIVSSRHCDIPEVIQDGNTGFLANERDVDGLYDCLLRAIREPDKWPRMLACGRKHIETEFNAVIQGLRLAQHYESAIGGNPRHRS